ncbi:hypothetical protein CWE23_04060 [Idiomarina aquatica]|uniref:Uncharacterized protein n=2 Tax=Idiomarina aquatica TaxID=1327752 RepID=A0AA94EHR6_9GAMM|nr:hypothetical protein CWE23_04060 [Idiomarina aquatica]
MSVHVFADTATPATAKQIAEKLQTSDDTVHVFYSHPSVYVAHGLEQGKKAADVCSDWLNGINEALQAQRKNRRKVRLLCLQDALEHQDALAEQTELDSNELAVFDVSPGHLTLMAGHQLVLQNNDIMAIIEQLEASTLQLSEQAYHVDVDVESVLQQANDTVARASSTSQELEKIKKERDDAVVRASGTSQELEQLKKERDEAVTRASGTSNELKEAKEENELLLLQLQQVQEEYETSLDKQQELKNAKDEAEAQASVLNKELEQIKQELSNSIKRADEAEKKAADVSMLKNLESENELLLNELQNIQEELERKQIKQSELLKTEDSLKKENDEIFEQLQKLQEQFETEVISNAEALKKAEKRNREINEKRMANEKKIDAKYKEQIATLKADNKKLLKQLMDTQAQLEVALADTVSKKQLNQAHKERNEAVARASGASKELAQLKKERDEAVARASGASKELLAQKEAEIARLNQQLITLELQTLNQQFQASNTRTEETQQTAEPVITATRDTDSAASAETATSVAMEPTTTKQPAKRALSSRIKNRLKLGKRKGSDKNAWIKEQAAQLQSSKYFDGQWYLQQYPDLQEAGVNPAEHYLRFGGFEARDPSPKFNSAFYLEQNPDVAQEGVNPLLHFVLYGEAEGRLPKPQPKNTNK